MAVCMYCGDSFIGDAFTSLCPTCRRRFREGAIRRCTACGKFIAEVDAIRVSVYGEESFICRNCECHTVQCCVCGENTLVMTAVSNQSGTQYACSHHGLAMCARCGELREVRMSTCNGSYCSECVKNDTSLLYLSRVESEDLLKAYNYKPPKYKLQHNHEKQRIYLGFELEAGYLEDEVAQAKAICNISDILGDKGFLKHDGSIPKYGFEVVSQPMTRSVHRCTSWDTIIEAMRAEGMHIYKEVENPERDTHYPCGLHIHINRNALSQQKWITLDWFIQRFRKFWEVIGRRPQSEYARYKSLRCVQSKRFKLHEVCGVSSDRYQAVNFCNKDTVELRLFNSTLDYEVLMATLEVVHAAVTWADTVHACNILKEGAVTSFMNHIKTHKQYEKAAKWLATLF